MRSRSSMTPETLVETYCHNFLTPNLDQMGVVKCIIWKQLQEHSQTAKELIALVKAEEKNRTPQENRPSSGRNQVPPAKKETLAADIQQASSCRLAGGGFIDRSEVKYSFKDDKVEA